MKRILLVVGLAFVALLAVLVVLAERQKAARGPEQSFALYNSADHPVSVTFHLRQEDGSFGGWTEHALVAPGELRRTRLPRGEWKIDVWDGDVHADATKLLREAGELEIALPDGEDADNPIFVDTTGRTTFLVVDVNFLYAGSGLAAELSRSLGTRRTRPVIKEVRDGSRLFTLPAHYFLGTLVKPGDELPASIGSGTVVYALVPVPAGVRKADEALEHVMRFLAARAR